MEREKVIDQPKRNFHCHNDLWFGMKERAAAHQAGVSEYLMILIGKDMGLEDDEIARYLPDGDVRKLNTKKTIQARPKKK